jgi:hypothetical protein
LWVHVLVCAHVLVWVHVLVCAHVLVWVHVLVWARVLVCVHVPRVAGPHADTTGTHAIEGARAFEGAGVRLHVVF